MSQLIVGKRYAKALFEVAKEQGSITETEQDLASVVQTIQQNSEFSALLEHPNIATITKVNLLKEAFGGKVSEIVLNTLLLAVEKGREAILTSLYTAFVAFVNEELARAQATVYSPFALSDAEKTTIAEKFGKLTNKTISVTNVVKPELLGGIQVRIGDQLFDGSLQGKLKGMEKTLTQNAM